MNPHPRHQEGLKMNPRTHHDYDNALQPGVIYEAIFRQPVTGETRTVQIIRFAGCEAWKARIQEPRNVLSRLGEQCEFSSAYAGRTSVTSYFRESLGLELVRQWKQTWAAAWSTLPGFLGPAAPEGLMQ